MKENKEWHSVKKMREHAKVNKYSINPLYIIGDVVLYPDRYEDPEKKGFVEIYQSRVIEAYAFFSEGETCTWFYQTEETKESGADSLQNEDIITAIRYGK